MSHCLSLFHKFLHVKESVAHDGVHMECVCGASYCWCLAHLHRRLQRSDALQSVDVHDSICADSALVYQPATLDEQPVRVGVLLLRAVELFQALGGLLAAQAHAMQ